MRKAVRKLFIVPAVVFAIAGSGIAIADADEDYARKGRLIRAEGKFTVEIDFSTLQLTPVKDQCFLEIKGIATFTGTLEGVAPGRTRALAFADCRTVASVPPGVYEDVFRSRLEFVGTVKGKPTFFDISYRGITQVGGGIDAVMLLSNGAKGLFKVDAIVAEGGSYEGFIRSE